MTAEEIRKSYEEFFAGAMEESKEIQAVAVDKKRQHELPRLLAEFSGTQQSKTLETWVEIAAQLAELNDTVASYCFWLSGGRVSSGKHSPASDSLPMESPK